MKYFKNAFVSIAFIAAAMMVIQSCGGDKPNRPDPVLTQDQIDRSINQVQPPVVPSGQTAPGGVKHYICPNGHLEGGADSQGTCINCGAALVHNQAYHNQASTPTPQPGANVPTNAPPPTEPAQNAAGVWHYTCPNGHAGGAGGPSACPECGATLAHNQAYHQ